MIVAAEELTWKQRAVLHFVRDYFRRNQMAPTFSEIKAACGLSSTSVVAYNLRKLARLGFIKLPPAAPGKTAPARSMRLVMQPGDPCPFCGRSE